MRLAEQEKQTVTVKPAAEATVYQENDRLYRFNNEQAFAIRAAIQPASEQTSAAVYGQMWDARILMLCDGGEQLVQGMGVCVDAAAAAPCDYRIAEQPRRYKRHKEYTLAWIPPEQRG